jgi:hypothetical protein
VSSYWQQLEREQRLLERHDMANAPDSLQLLELMDSVFNRIAALERALGLQSHQTRHGWQVTRDDAR